jgi:outer membrane protein TolC
VNLIVAFVLLAVASGDADVTGARPLALEDAQREGRAHAPEREVLAARLRGAEAVARDAQRSLRSDPSLSGRFSTGAAGDTPNERSLELGLEWTLDISGSSRFRGASAESSRVRVAWEREDGLRALDEAVAVTVADLAFAQRAVRRAEKIAAIQELALASEQKRLAVGEGTTLEVDGALVEEAAAAAALEAARGDLDRARLRLSRLLGRTSADGLSVLDPAESTALDSDIIPEGLVDADPRVRAAEAEAASAGLEQGLERRLTWPAPTLGLDVAAIHNEVPGAALAAAGVAGGDVRWKDLELGLRLSLPLPLVDRRREARTRVDARLWAAEAEVARVRADVRLEVNTALTDLRAARRTFAAIARSAEPIERDYALLDKAVRAGAMDGLTRSFAVRRLVESAVRLDTVTRDLRIARAKWRRLVASGAR